MATPPFADGPGVLAGPARDLPGAEGDGVVLTVATRPILPLRVVALVKVAPAPLLVR
jgi:hypothetical protein